MKKIILVSATCFAIVSIYAQNKQVAPLPPPVPPVASLQLPPAPPLPPVPPVPDISNEAVPPPPPPAPPVPPKPPVPPVISQHFGDDDNSIYQVNSSDGDESQLMVKNIKGISTVIVKKDGKTHYIKMDTWEKNKKYYEGKYGKLPPPPPPAPPKVKTVRFAPPVIKSDKIN